MSFQGRQFTAEMKQLVVNLKLHHDAERQAGREVSTRNATVRTAKGLSIGEATVKRIMAEYHRNGQRLVDPSCQVRGKPNYRVAVNLQPVIREYIRSQNLAGQRVGIKKLRAHLIDQHHAEIPVATLWRALRRWGFMHGTGQRRSALKERDYVILARRKYLRVKRANRYSDGTLKRPEVYLDETYITKNHSSRFTWYLNEDGPWVNKPSGQGPRLIIVHAITQEGWVNDAELVFQAKKRTGDYHGQMDGDNFFRWFSEQLLPNIPAHSLIMMDNAKYHKVLADDAFPTPKTRKQQLRDWLSKNHYPWTEDMLKPELLALCQRFAPIPEFKLDQLAEAHGHTILRTPQYHPELQPIETCWAIVKNYMADHCDFKMATLWSHLPDAFAEVSAHTCQKLIAKVVQQEEKFWTEDDQLDELNEGDDTAYGFDELNLDAEDYEVCEDCEGE